MIEAFVPRTTDPSTSNLYYIKRNSTFHGYNRCIIINNSNGSVLPNCTGYAWGRFCECQNNVHDCKLSRANAELWYGNTLDGYSRGQTPKLGAVICWHSTRSGGHVAIVEQINEDGSILTSNSAYNGKRFYMKTLYPPTYKMGSSYTFQGFIYNPTTFIEPSPTPVGAGTKNKFPWVLYARKFRKHIR